MNDKLAAKYKWIAAGLVCLFISPIIFMVIKGAVGLIAAFIVGQAALQFAPWYSMKLANWRLKSMKHEARTNPVETLQNQFLAKCDQLRLFAQSITDFRTEVSGFTDTVEGYAAQYPNDAANYRRQLAQMEALLARREAKYQDATQAVQKFKGEVDRAQAKWNMSQAAQRMNKAAKAQGGEFLDNLMRDEAFSAINTSMNRAFAELETALLEESSPMQLPAPVAAVVLEYAPAKERVS